MANLQRLLHRLGYYDGEADGEFGRSTERAVEAWASSLGVVKPSGVFDPGWVVWLPVEPFVVELLETRVGLAAPAPGMVLLSGPVPLELVRISTSEGAPAAVRGEWILETAGEKFRVLDGELIDADRVRLGELLDPGTTDLSGQIRRSDPPSVIEIPATAVLSGRDGSLCVFVPSDAGFEPRPVVLGGGRVSRVNVVSGLAPGDEVLFNPADVLPSPQCP